MLKRNMSSSWNSNFICKLKGLIANVPPPNTFGVGWQFFYTLLSRRLCARSASCMNIGVDQFLLFQMDHICRFLFSIIPLVEGMFCRFERSLATVQESNILMPRTN